MLKPMRAGKLTVDDFDKLVFPIIASPKIDGIRCLGHGGKLFTKSMKLVPNKYLQAFFKEIYDYIPEIGILDGEMVAGRPEDLTNKEVFSKTTTAVMSHNIEIPCTYWIFDDAQFPDIGYWDRLSLARHAINRISSTVFTRYSKPPITFRLLESLICHSVEDILLCEEKWLEQGYEGIMLRNSERPYKFGDSSVNPKQQHLLKFKRFEDAEGLVIGVKELMHNNNEATIGELGQTERSGHKENLVGGNMLGALTVKVLNGEFENVEVDVGTGFTAEQRIELWGRGDLIGKTITFKYQACGSKDAPRFPSYKGFRENE